jgi:NAD(P)-dependent dehydrogenase (short-subunit alcohol dehydrogenase family)
VVTGASSGIGLETCKVLASKGCRVIMCCRDVQAARDASQSLTLATTFSHTLTLTLTLTPTLTTKAMTQLRPN